jgi:hypothetical protein
MNEANFRQHHHNNIMGLGVTPLSPPKAKVVKPSDFGVRRNIT